MLSSNGKMVTASLSPDTDTGEILQGRGKSPATRNGDYESSGSGDCFYSIMTLFAIKMVLSFIKTPLWKLIETQSQCPDLKERHHIYMKMRLSTLKRISHFP